MKIILETERLIVREYVADDAEAFFQLNRDPEVMRYTGDEMLESVDQAREILRLHPIADYRKYGFGRFACVLKATRENIGYTGLKFLPELDEVEVGFRLVRRHWGKGFATEAAKALLRYGFDELALPHIIGVVHPDNRASMRVLEKAGLKFVGMVNLPPWPMRKYVIHCDDQSIRGANPSSGAPAS